MLRSATPGEPAGPEIHNAARHAGLAPDGGVIVGLDNGSAIRFTADGVLDTSFGDAGVARPAGHEFAFGMTDFEVAPDGRFAVLADFDRSAGVFMFTAEGQQDTSFDDDGFTDIFADVVPDDDLGASAMGFESDGTLVVAWNTLLFSQDPLDPFHDSGVDLFDPSGAVTRHPIEIGTGGIDDLDIGPRDDIFLLTSFESNSLLFYSFFGLGPHGTTGGLASGTANMLSPESITALSDGGVLLGGITPDDADEDFADDLYAVARFTPSGAPDPTFGSGGLAVLDALPVPGSGPVVISTVPQRDDGAVIVAAVTEFPPIRQSMIRLQGDPTVRLTASGTLVVGGTSGDDDVRVYRRSRDGRIVARVNGVAHAFHRSRVKRIAVYARAGHDHVSIGPRVIGVRVDGGDGNDTLEGGFGDDVLIGGAGADQIFAFDGDDILVGGEGDDYCLGGAGNDDLFGDDGRDTLSGAGGNDRLLGGIGRDFIYGGAGVDKTEYEALDERKTIETYVA